VASEAAALGAAGARATYGAAAVPVASDVAERPCVELRGGEGASEALCVDAGPATAGGGARVSGGGPAGPRGGRPEAVTEGVGEHSPLSILEQKEAGGCQQSTYGKVSSADAYSVGQSPPPVERGVKSQIGGEAGFERRLGRYGRAKARADGVAEHLEAVASEWLARARASGRVGPDRWQWSESAFLARVPEAVRASRLRSCSAWLEFRRFYTHPDQPTKLSGGEFCHQHLLCQPCALHRSAKLVRAYVPKLLELAKSGLRPYLMTLTATSGEDLLERWKHLDQALRALVKAGWRSRTGAKGASHPWASIVGGVFSFETKRGSGTRGGLWHPHLHGVVFFEDDPWNDDELLQAWCDETGDSDIRGQDLRPLHCLVNGKLEMAASCEAWGEAFVAESVAGDLLEVFKYPLKASDLEPGDQWAFFQALRTRHLIRPFGALWGVTPSEVATDEFDLGDLPFMRLLCYYGGAGRGYAVSEAFAEGATGSARRVVRAPGREPSPVRVVLRGIDDRGGRNRKSVQRDFSLDNRVLRGKNGCE